MARAKRAWKPRPLYLAWVIGGLIAIVAFTIVKGLSDPTDQSVIFWLIPMLAVYMGGILFMQYRQANRVARDHPEAAGPPPRSSSGTSSSPRSSARRSSPASPPSTLASTRPSIRSATAVPGFPAVLLPAIVLVLIGAAKSMGVLRSIRRGETPK